VAGYADAADRVAAVAGRLLPTLHRLRLVGGVSTAMAAVGAAALFDFDATGLAVGAGALVLFAVPVVTVHRFAADLAQVRRLPEVTPAHYEAAAQDLADSVSERGRRVTEARGVLRAWEVGRAAWGIRADLGELADGGLAPARALVDTLNPIRIGWVTASALSIPLLGICAGILLFTGLVFV
jgi:hypothetical protein